MAVQTHSHPSRLKVLLLSGAILAAPLAAPLAIAGPAAAEVVETVEVEGARMVPEADIVATCGPIVGEVLDRFSLSAIEDCLMYTGAFEEVSLRREGARLVIHVKEIETSPGRIEAGIAWTTDLGLTGTLDYQQFNLIPDTYLSIRNRFNRESKSYEINALRQDAFGEGLHFGLELSGRRTAFDDQNFRSRADQVEVWLGRQLAEKSRLDVGLGYRRQKLHGLKAGAGAQLRAEEGTARGAFAHVALSHATQGEGPALNLYLDGFAWNLGTGSPVLELRGEAFGRFALGAGTDLQLTLRGGVVRGLKDHDPTILDRAFLGGETLRGFAPRGLGPKEGGDWLGGERHLMAGVELQRKIATIAGTDLRGGLFAEAGTLWRVSGKVAGLDDAAHLRASAGISLSFDIGEVPVSIYLAHPLRKEAGDETQALGISLAARF